MSPTFFNLHAEQTIQEIKEKLNRQKIGVIIKGELVQQIRFTDYIVLITTNEKELEIVLKEMQGCFEEYDLKIKYM